MMKSLSATTFGLLMERIKKSLTAISFQMQSNITYLKIDVKNCKKCRKTEKLIIIINNNFI